jgi:hypothetical protein
MNRGDGESADEVRGSGVDRLPATSSRAACRQEQEALTYNDTFWFLGKMAVKRMSLAEHL